MCEAGSSLILPEELALIEELPKRPVVFDVGANVGDFTAAVIERRPSARVVAFEAQESARRVFESRFPQTQVPLWGPLGARDEQRVLYSDAEASQLGTFYPRPHVPEIREQPLGEVMVWTLASLWPQLGVERVDLLKIDTEGSELDVLRGAAPVLDRVETIAWENTTGPSAYKGADGESPSTATFDMLLDPLGFELRQLRPPQGGIELLAARRKETHA